MVEGFATGQWTAGSLSSADTRTTIRSTGELRYFNTAPTTQPYIGMSALFTEKALATGILVPSTPGGTFYSNTGQYYNLNPQADTLINQGTKTPQTQIPSGTTSTQSGIGLIPILLVGGLLLLGGLKI